MNRAERDVVIFVVLLIAAGWGGVAINSATGAGEDPFGGLGTLLWLVTPALTGLVLSILAGNWFKRLGLGFHFGGYSRLYFLALLAAPVTILALIGLGLTLGMISAGPGPEEGLVAFMLSLTVSTLIKNIFEEYAWRGFLTARLEETRFTGLANHGVTGVVWAVWHLPYWFLFISPAEISAHSGLSVPAFVVLATVMLLLQAPLYGELRLQTGSVWPAYILHTFSNLVSIGLLTGQVLVVTGPWAAVIAPGESALLYGVVMFGLGLMLYLRRTGRAQEVPA